jgi:hypothetical protein
MTPDTLWIIKVIFGCLGGLFTALAAVFTFCETAQNEKYDDTRAWFGAKWEAINYSRWLTLPEQTVVWFLQVGKKDWTAVVGDAFFNRDWLSRPIAFIVTAFSFFALTYFAGVYGAVVAIVLAVPILVGIVANRPFEIKWLGDKISDLYSGLSIVITFGGAVILWTVLLLQLSIYYVAPIMFLLFPIYWFLFLLPVLMLTDLRFISPETMRRLILFALGVAAGFTATFIALLVGHVADPVAPVPQTFQMLASNVLIDGLTMVVTFSILSWAVERGWLFSIPLAVFLDLLAAAVLACCSLYFALVGTEHALSVHEVLNVLVAHSPDGSRVELSPYFWTMHTTFLPTLAYLALILVTWFAKLILTPVKWFFGKGHEHKSPLKLTAALCGMIAVVFGLFTVGADSAHERAKEKAAAATPPAAVK